MISKEVFQLHIKRKGEVAESCTTTGIESTVFENARLQHGLVFETHFDQFNDLSLYNSETKMPL
jgi:hypothetical protein